MVELNKDPEEIKRRAFEMARFSMFIETLSSEPNRDQVEDYATILRDTIVLKIQTPEGAAEEVSSIADIISVAQREYHKSCEKHGKKINLKQEKYLEKLLLAQFKFYCFILDTIADEEEKSFRKEVFGE